jgi:thiol:disulfide interchange protein
VTASINLKALSGRAPGASSGRMTRPSTFSALKTLALLTLACCGLAAGPALSAPLNSGHVQVELVADQASVAPGGVVHVALHQVIKPGWHTYWRNPGDSGQATTLTWTLPTGWSAGDIIWAPPKKLPLPPLMDYGYEGDVLLPVAITAPSGATVGQPVALKVHADYLVCEKVCVPESADLSLTLPVAATATPDPVWSGPIQIALSMSPKPAGLKAAVTPGTTLKLSITGDALKGVNVADAYFFPFDSSDIDHAQPQTIEHGADGLTLSLTPGLAFKGPKPADHMDGVLSVGGKVYEVDAPTGPPLAGASGSSGLSAILVAIASAFVGGLILNLMPCVFPILSMKAVALTRHAHGKTSGLHGLVFMAGVVATFLALAIALIAARAAGQAVGWGFQLQSPPVVAGLALIMLLTALNLSGVFEVGESIQAAAGEAGGADAGGLWGSALTGALAVAVAAPCTAPFMAPAIGFALTQSPVISLAIFLSLGLGLAAPFTALAFAPALLKLLPRPGVWMETLKGVLAFPMYGAAAWLVWVFSQQAGTLGLAALMAAAVFTGFAAWLYGKAQAIRIAGGKPWVRVGFAVVAIACAAVLAFWPEAPPPAAGAVASSAGGLPTEPYSVARLQALQAQGKPVLVDFTAAWCVTCQVNERVALSTAPVAEAFKQAGAVYMVGDWTNRNAEIAQTLAAHGRAGVPLYLMYSKAGGEPVVLPQILTPGIVVDAVKKAAA